jgi:hypothetical protein
MNEKVSESVWREGQVEIRAHGENEFMVRKYLRAVFFRFF